MQQVWAAIAVVILALVLWGIVSSKLKSRRIRAASERTLPTVANHLTPERRYDIFLSHGKTLRGVTFLGISRPYDQSAPELPFPLCQWVVVQKPEGGRAYIKPESVRYYEEVDDKPR